MIFNQDVIENWEANYEKLVAYKVRFDNTNVPYNWKEDRKLAKWVKLQRKEKHQLPTEYRNRLIAIEFDFSENQFPWDEKFDELTQFARTHGHVHVPAHDDRYFHLYDWLINQIRNKDFLSEERRKKLDYLGVVWEYITAREWQWQEYYMLLADFFKKYGHSNVPFKWQKNPRLATWVRVQRRRFAEGKMDPERKTRLESLNFVWDFKGKYDHQWEEGFKQMLNFKKEHGHCRVPLSYKENPKLAGWVDRQRTSKSQGKLKPEREARLEKIGFIWNFKEINEKSWEEKFQQLLDYRKEHGNCLVPTNWKENISLGVWVSGQRILEEKGKLEQEKVDRLNEIGFIWRKDVKKVQAHIYNEQWEKNFQKLIEYKKKYGKLQVSLKIDPSLQRWTCIQRRFYFERKLSKQRIKKLNEIGFAWDLHEAYWMDMYSQLVDYKKKYGHTKVPWMWEGNPRLGQWVSRVRLHKNELTEDQIKLLDNIKFDWKTIKKKVVPWDEMFNMLNNFRKRYGHTRVPVLWSENPKLGKWVSRMRYNKNEILPERLKKLEQINFEWGAKKGRVKGKKHVLSEVAPLP